MNVPWEFKNFSAVFERKDFRIPDWKIALGEAWFLTGNLEADFDRVIDILRQEYKEDEGFSVISFRYQQDLYEREIHEDDSDFMDCQDKGTLVREFLADNEGNLPELWIEQLHVRHLLNQGLRFLSTGETRKVLLINALQKKPKILLLDEPYAGLDAESCHLLNMWLHEWHEQGLTILLLSRRTSYMPSWVTHIAYVNETAVAFTLPIEKARNNPDWQQLLHIDSQPLPDIPLSDPLTSLPALPAGEPLIELRNISVGYGERLVLKSFSWRVEQGEHWRIVGPNGSGKSTLLSVISGDHPQCYSNDVRIFGFRRGSGESIWQIRRHYGLVSGQLHRNYRVSCNVLTVVLSGLFDSIGLYQPVTNTQKKLAMQWLEYFHLDKKASQSFHKLGHGEQRLVLIARALIKHPHLLILDEPCEGLDELSRQLVLRVINQLAENSESTLLYVSHDADDYLPMIRHRLELTPLI
jgi:molybdate transport system ATP-binding protein